MRTWSNPGFLSGAIFLGFLATGCQEPYREASASESPPVRTDSPTKHPILGTQSCSSRGCHGNLDLGALAPPGSEPRFSPSSYSRWLDQDPHAKAFQVLSSDLARKMGEKLRIPNVKEDPRCLACHVTPQAANLESWAKEEHRFGVGCESCHGSANLWIEPHKSKEWQAKSKNEKLTAQKILGMQPLSSLSSRATVCAGCHIGAPANPQKGIPVRDMDHDFIAAGHPRLMFEFGAFLANEPKHWAEKDKSPDFEARAWLSGQLASGDAALSLLVDRVQSQRVWPEFSEFDCYACHHDLDQPSWRQNRTTPQLGKLRLSRWYYDLLSLVIDQPISLAEIDRPLSQSLPSKAKVAEEAQKLRQKLQDAAKEWESKSFSRESLAQLRTKLATRAVENRDLGWEEWEQIALGLQAIVESEQQFSPMGATDPLIAKRKATIKELLKRLAFPEGHSSPRSFLKPPGFDKDLIPLVESLK